MATLSFCRKLLVVGVFAGACGGASGATAYVEGSRMAAVSTGALMTPDTKVVVDFAFTDPSRRAEWLFGCQGALGASFVRGSMNVYCWILENTMP